MTVETIRVTFRTELLEVIQPNTSPSESPRSTPSPTATTEPSPTPTNMSPNEEIRLAQSPSTQEKVDEVVKDVLEKIVETACKSAEENVANKQGKEEKPEVSTCSVQIRAEVSVEITEVVSSEAALEAKKQDLAQTNTETGETKKTITEIHPSPKDAEHAWLDHPVDQWKLDRLASAKGAIKMILNKVVRNFDEEVWTEIEKVNLVAIKTLRELEAHAVRLFNASNDPHHLKLDSHIKLKKQLKVVHEATWTGDLVRVLWQ